MWIRSRKRTYTHAIPLVRGLLKYSVCVICKEHCLECVNASIASRDSTTRKKAKLLIPFHAWMQIDWWRDKAIQKWENACIFGMLAPMWKWLRVAWLKLGVSVIGKRRKSRRESQQREGRKERKDVWGCAHVRRSWYGPIKSRHTILVAPSGILRQGREESEDVRIHGIE